MIQNNRPRLEKQRCIHKVFAETVLKMWCQYHENYITGNKNLSCLDCINYDEGE